MLIDIIGSTVIFSTLKDWNLEMGATVSTHGKKKRVSTGSFRGGGGVGIQNP